MWPQLLANCRLEPRINKTNAVSCGKEQWLNRALTKVAVSLLLLTTPRSIAEEERRARANDREYNEKFQYAVSGPCFRLEGEEYC